MTPKDKAKKLVEKFMSIDSDSEKFDGFKMKTFYAQRCALIAVEEIYKTNLIFGRYEYEENPEFFYSYWEEVKQEIEKL